MTEIEYAIPDPNRVLGIDVSHWAADTVDFQTAKQNGLDFAIIKAKYEPI